VRRRMKGSEGCQQARERNDLAKVLERLQQTSQVRLPDSLRSLFQNARAKTAGKMTEGIGETEILPTPSVSSEPGRRG
jgi:hypothetical protein